MLYCVSGWPDDSDIDGVSDPDRSAALGFFPLSPVLGGIDIAFPQRDVHLNATHPIEVRVLPGDVRQQSRDHASEPPTD